MPKEYAHFRIAERTAELLAASRLGPDASPRGALRPPLLLGAILHDALYYLATPGRREAPGVLKLPDLLHGKHGADSHALLRAQARHAAALAEAGSPRAADARALLVGLVSHHCADVALHPLIFHLSGDYDAEPGAVERHRLLESCLDLVVAGSRAELRARRIGTLLRQCPPGPLSPLDFFAALAGRPGQEVRDALDRAWRVFARMQGLALSWAGASLALLRPLCPGRARLPREVLALLYPPAASVRPVLHFLSGRIRYRHPVTNAPRTATIAGLMEEAAQEAARLCGRLEPALFDGADPGDLLGPGPGPGLDTGLNTGLDTGLDTVLVSRQNSGAHAAANAVRPRHFAEPRFPEI